MRGLPLIALAIVLLLLLPDAPLTPASLAQAGSGTPTFAVYAAPSSLPNSDNAGEPSIGVDWKTNSAGGGTVMYQAYASTYKVVFNDATVPATATWTSVTPSGSSFNIDPILFTDSTLGRTWAGGLSGACSILFYSDNDGGSWSPPINTCSGVVDHESIGAGPYHGSAPLLAQYSHAVYYCSQNGVDACTASTDGGTTYGAPATVGGACGGLHGHIKVSADGTAYLPNQNCGGKAGGGITSSNGGSWSSYTIAQSTTRGRGFDPSVATTPDNTIYEAWADGASDQPYVARSTNHGATWDRVTNLASTVSGGIVASTFQDVVAGDNGRVAVAFLGTQVGGGAATPFDNGYTGVWNLYVSYSYDAGLTWTTVKVTQDSDPVQRGCLWDGGGTNVCRNLLDFMDASLTKDGRVVVGFADGCINACTTIAQSTHAYATIARQSTGKGLFAAYDSAGPSPPAAPTLTATAGNAQVALSWTTPANGGSAITGYNVYRGATSGSETLYQSLGVVNAYTDTGVANGNTYYYEVAAVNVAGAGALSNEGSATPSAPNSPPTACFTHSETGSSTSVSGACSSDSDGTIASYDWNWGDGSAHGTGASASHAYATGGTKTVTLTVTDNGGATGSTSQGVTVSGPPNSPPTACFSSSSSGLTASFTGTCSTDSDGTIASYAWTFGDSTSGTGATPSHTYAAAGTYTVTLTVTDNGGATGSVSHPVTVVSDPDPGTPNLTNGVATSGTSAPTSGTWQYYKIQVPAGKTQLKVDLASSQSCGLLSCNPDLDLYVRQAAKPTTSAYDCSPQTGTSTESCTISSPAAAYWYVGINVYSGSASLAYTVKATYS